MSLRSQRPFPLLALFAVLCSVFFSGCGGSKYRPLTVDEVNELAPQRPAVITLSDPQVYSRETLVNDRRREAEYLKHLLEESVTEVFEPQIRRDLRTLTSTVLKLEASYNPLAGRGAEREEELAVIDQRIAETERLQKLAEARVKLVEAERRLDELARAAAAASSSDGAQKPEVGAKGTENEDGGNGKDQEGEQAADQKDEPASDQVKKVEALRANVEELGKLMAALPSTAKEMRQAAVGATPREIFRDRQAYRGELRSALSEVELDDAHDQGQNSLYRLQFRATVLPGQHQDKMGVARLTLKPPTLTNQHILELYKTWLGHVTFRLNQAPNEHLHTDRSYLLLGMGLERSLFHATTIPLLNSGKELRIALPPDAYATWKALVDDEQPKKSLADLKDRIRSVGTWINCLGSDHREDALAARHLVRREAREREAVAEVCRLFHLSPGATDGEGCQIARGLCKSESSRCSSRGSFHPGDGARTACEQAHIGKPDGCRAGDSAAGYIAQKRLQDELWCKDDPFLKNLEKEHRRDRKYREDQEGLERKLRDEALEQALRLAQEVRCLRGAICCQVDAPGRRVEKALTLDSATCQPTGDVREHFYLLEELSYLEPFVSASLRGLGDTSLVDSKLAEDLDKLIEDFTNGSETIDRLRRLLIQHNPACADRLALGTSLQEQYRAMPKAFVEALLRDCHGPGASCTFEEKDEQKKGRRRARGGADVYATAPVELAQQISTTASAFRSFELAVALAASLPTSGVGAEAALNRLRATRTDLEARERLPLVVGFAERRQRETIGEDPQFGWVFGPQAVIDAGENRLRLRQPVVNQVVTADLSIPGWWPWVELESETAWIANWHEGTILRTGGETARTRAGATRQEFRAYLPLNRADLDAMTGYLAKSTAGGTLPYTRIVAVSPEKVTTCEDRVTFLVHGANVWRSSRAFLNGLEAEEIRVLPDMAGLAVTFAGIRKGLPQVPEKNGEAVITLWTRNGSSSATVTVLDPKTAGLSCGPVEEPGLKLAVEPRVLIPVKERKDTAPVRVKVVRGKLPAAYAKLGISVRPPGSLSDRAMYAWSGLQEKTAEVKADSVVGAVSLANLTLKSGDPLQVSLVEIPVPGAEAKRHSVDGTLVYYASAEEANIQVAPEKIKDLSDAVILTLPYRYDLSYPELQAGRVTFGVEAQGASAGEYRISLKSPRPAELPSATGSYADRGLRFHLVVEKGGEPLAGEELAAFLKSKPTFSFTIRGGKDLPRVDGKVEVSG